MTDMAVSRRYVWQNKITRFIFSFFIAIGVIVQTIAPFSIVKADSDINYFSDVSDFVYTGVSWDRYGTTRVYIWIGAQQPSVDCFLVVDGRRLHYVFVSDTDNVARYQEMHNSSTSAPGSYSYANLEYNSTNSVYYAIPSTYSANSSYYVDQSVNQNRIIYYNGFGQLSVDNKLAYVLQYRVPSIDYGNIKDLSYSTNIVGSGTTTGDANIDTISWYPYWDSNSNISTTWNMQIQVVPGTWQGGTNTDIFSQTYQNFIINESGAMDIYRGTYLNGSYSISWGEVKNKLSILSWADLFQYFDGSYWNKKGWVYRARYNDPDNDYWSEWQTVYTVTSSAGEGVENIIDPDDGTGLPDFNNNVQNSYNTTSVVNNNYNVTYYYNGVPVVTNENEQEINDYSEQIYYLTKQIRDILINLNTTNSTTENNDNDETITNNLNSVVDNLHNTENGFMTDMDEKLTDIDNTFELLNNNKFIAAANWVRTQYDNIVLDTPFELLIVFGLILSLALVIVGKVK